ncbi:hypothetical protein AUK10_02355 [Candidatus Gracilibacteria bacterium CG2_30_37_12]|nr:MAG: hypothetical protein AUK10_02355 [Candidatus Gracilibacteria bacterium CG2_30_37_12]
MSNRFLSFIILALVFSGLFGAYYFFFVASNANITILLDGIGTTSVVLDSEFGKNYTQECSTTCIFEKIPAVKYTLSAKREGYVSVENTFTLQRGEDKKLTIIMEKKIELSEQKKDKTEAITLIKLKNSITKTLEENTGSMLLGYQSGGLYFSLPNGGEFDIFVQKEGTEARKLFQIPNGTFTNESLDVYEGYIALQKGENTIFYSLQNGQETIFAFSGTIIGVKDTSDINTKIITSNTGVFTYSLTEKTARINPLYDDIIILPSGEIIALVKKSSREKQSLLSLSDISNDTIFLIGQDTRERKAIFKTPKMGEVLRYKNGEILFVDENGEVSVIKNVR